MRKLKTIFIAIGALVFAAAVFIAGSWIGTEAVIDNHRERVAAIAMAHPTPVYDPAVAEVLPEPVKRYFRFAFRGGGHPVQLVQMRMQGDFRRPNSQGFSPTSAQQTIAAGVPAFVFAATTPIVPGIWARAYDAFAEMKMEMKAKLLSAITVMDEKETPALNRTSLRRWLIECSLFPAALLPGGPVSWEPVDENRARAVVSAGGVKASLIATFRPDGSLERFDAEEDGDLTTPYHGSGEHVLRSDYREVSGMMIPHAFTIARAAGGRIWPFWKGRITSMEIITADESME